MRPEEEDDSGKVTSFVWETAIGLEHVPVSEQPGLIAELAQLLEYGLPNVGKSRAIAEVEWLNAPTPGKVAQGFAAGTEHVAALQTEFLMTDPRTLGSGRPEDLEKAYREFWKEVSEGPWSWFATSPGNRCTGAISPDVRDGPITSRSWSPTAAARSC